MKKLMVFFSKIIKKAYILFRDLVVGLLLSRLSEKNRFRLIYKSGYWKGVDGTSVSGYGSNMDSTFQIQRNLSKFVINYNIKSILDIPCGDFNWMRNVNLKDVIYIGADIVEELIVENQKKHSAPRRSFLCLDIIEDKLLKVDLIFTRDCFVHLEEEQILKALVNISNSDAMFFAATTYNSVSENEKPTLKDRWRPINLTLPPFNLPEPLVLLNDSWSNNQFDQEKKIGVWRIGDIKISNSNIG